MTTIRDLLRSGSGAVPLFESEILLAHALNKTRTFVVAHPEYVLPKKREKNFTEFFERRKNHEPIALIVGSKEFYGREFLINRHTLVPRPETELLVEKTLEHIAASSKKKFPTLVIDMGTGSGNIITTLVRELEVKNISKEDFLYIATDISKEALLIAKKNAQKHHAEKNIRFIQSDILENIPKKFFRNAREIIITANLPYLSKKEYEDAPPDVRNFEPKSALESGTSGLDHYQKLLKELRSVILERKLPSTKTTLFFEISPRQKNSMQQLVSSIFPEARLTFSRDLAQKWRLAQIQI